MKTENVILRFTDPDTSLGPMLTSLQKVVADKPSKRHIGNLWNWLGEERLFGEDWWADDSILARARQPLPPPPPKPSAKRKAKRGVQRAKSEL